MLPRYRSKVKPWPHQKSALKQVWKRGNALIWGDVGVGKTKVGVDYAIARYERGEVRRVLVVGPLPAVGVWREEFKKHAPPQTLIVTRNDVDRLSELVSVIHQARAFSQENGTLAVVVLTYEALSKYAKLLGDSYRPDLFLIDESHYIKEYSAIRTRRTLSVARHSKFCVALSGTPCPNGYEEFYWQVHALRPGLLGPTIQAFRDRYCVMGGYLGKEIIGYRNKRELAKRLAKVVVRIPKDVLKLPPSVDQIVPVKLDATARAAYDRLTKDLVTQLESGHRIEASNQLVLLLRCLQITGGFFEGHQIGKAMKLQVLLELLASETGKVVITAHFQQEIKAIFEALTKQGYTCAMLRGDVGGRQRDEIIRQFQTQDDPRFLIIQPKAAGISVTLTRAHVMYIYSMTYDSEAYHQAKGRIERGGQTNSCRYVHLVAEGTVDEEVMDGVRAKLSRQEVLGRVVRRLTTG